MIPTCMEFMDVLLHRPERNPEEQDEECGDGKWIRQHSLKPRVGLLETVC
jgi:hypothetical protein